MLRICANIKKRNIIAALLLLIIIEEEETRRNNRRIWTNPYLLKRNNKGMHHNFFMELAFKDPERFRRYNTINLLFF